MACINSLWIWQIWKICLHFDSRKNPDTQPQKMDNAVPQLKYDHVKMVAHMSATNV